MSRILSGIKMNIIEMVREAIESGEDVNTLDKSGSSPLFNAIIKKNLEIVELLIEKGADINCVVQNYSPLLLSIEQGQDEISKTLINAKAELNFRGIGGTFTCNKFNKNKTSQYHLSALQIQPADLN
jgi:uncharacterized protein